MHPLLISTTNTRPWVRLPPSVRLAFFSQQGCVSCAPPTSTNCQAFWRNPISLSLSPSTFLTISLLLSFSVAVVEIEMRLVRPLVVLKQTAVIDGQLIQSDPVELLTSH